MSNAEWVEDGPEAILCEKSSNEERSQLVLESVGVLWGSHLLPFHDKKE